MPITVLNPYETRHSGLLFGEHTASVDWCEPNYEVTEYVAESWNTLSSVLPWTWLSLLQLRHVFHERLPFRVALGPIGILAVSLGSAYFHGTLTLAGQQADELPMLLFIAIQFIVVLDMRPRSRSVALSDVLPPLSLVLLNTFVFYYYIKRGEEGFVFFCFAFAFQLAGATFLGMYLSQRKSIEPARRKEMIDLAVRGVVFFSTAFALWLCETQFCPAILRFRAQLPFPVAFFVSLHAVWHILAFYASTILSTAAQELNLSLTEPELDLRIDWRHAKLVPYLVKQSRAKKS